MLVDIYEYAIERDEGDAPTMPGSSGSGAVTRSTLRQQIADALRDEVLAGRLQPGQEFTVKEIAEQYGVSATPVRKLSSTSPRRDSWKPTSTAASASTSTRWPTTAG